MRVSVIIPVYNGAATVGEAIESALAESGDSAEIVVVNDGSTDSTPRVLEKYRPYIKVIHRDNGGLCAARNTGLKAASGECIALLDADDVWRPGRLLRTVEALGENPKAVLAFGDFRAVAESGAYIGDGKSGRAPSHSDLMERAWPIIPSAVTIRRGAIEKVGGFCEEFKGCAGGEDQYMWLLLSELGEFEYVPELLVIHRRKAAIETVDKYEPGRQTLIRLLRTRYGTMASKRIQETQNYFAGMLVVSATEALDAGNLMLALRLLARARHYRPLVLLQPALVARLAKVGNLRRIAKSFLKFGSRGAS